MKHHTITTAALRIGRGKSTIQRYLTNGLAHETRWISGAGYRVIIREDNLLTYERDVRSRTVATKSIPIPGQSSER